MVEVSFFPVESDISRINQHTFVSINGCLLLSRFVLQDIIMWIASHAFGPTKVTLSVIDGPFLRVLHHLCYQVDLPNLRASWDFSQVQTTTIIWSIDQQANPM